MSEQIGPILEAIRLAQEINRAGHRAMMAQFEVNRLEHEANRRAHETMMAQLQTMDRANREDHDAFLAPVEGPEASPDEYDALLVRVEAMEKAAREDHDAFLARGKAMERTGPPDFEEVLNRIRKLSTPTQP